MSILVEIADRADSTVEDIVRVLTREPVGDGVRERVLAVLDGLGGAEARVIERFALAAIHDAAPPQTERRGEADEIAADGSPQGASSPDISQGEVLTAHVGLLLEELVNAVSEIRRESLADRRERIDDLAVLVELLTTGWRRVDRRLGRVERLVERLEAARPLGGAPFETDPVLTVPIRAGVDRIEAARIDPVRSLPPRDEAPSEPKRSWLPPTAILVLLACAIMAILAFDLLPSSSDRPRLLTESQSATSPSTQAPSTTTSAPRATTPVPTSPAPAVPRTTATPRTTTPARTSTAPAVTRTDAVIPPPQGARLPPAPATTTPTPTRSSTQRTTPAPIGTPRGTTTGPKGFRPGRVFVWAPADGADYYVVRFLRNDALFYQAWPLGPRLTLPKTLVFRPGSYRWVVRPGIGPRAAKRVGSPLVDSTFSVGR